MKLLLIRDKNFMVQESLRSADRVEIRIDDSKGKKVRASIIRQGNVWAFSLEEWRGFWSRGSNVGHSQAPDIESAYSDMFYHIRCCNYHVEVQSA